MKRLSQHILSLLRHSDFVVLPGVGEFHINYVSAAADQTMSIYLPPHFEISFKENPSALPAMSGDILGEDNVLLDSYIRKYGCTVEEASDMLDADLAEFRNYLSFGGNPVLPEFKAINPPFPPIHLNSVSWSNAPKGEVEIMEEREKEDERKGWRNPNYYYIPVHKKLAKIAACLLLVLAVGLGAILPMPLGQPTQKPAAASIVPISVNENKTTIKKEREAVVADDQEEVTDYVNENENLDKDAENSALPSTPFSEETLRDQHKYFAIIAAFKSEKEADKFLERAKGDKSRYNIIKNSRYYMISVGSSIEKDELESNLPLIRTDFPDAWIYALK